MIPAQCFQTACLLLAVLIAGGCTVFEPPDRPADPVGLPEAFAWSRNGTAGLEAWWRSFDSPELNHLMEAALEGNPDIRTAWARLRQAGAEAAKTRAALFPSLEAGLEASRTQTYVDGERIADSKEASLGLAAAYELDLWGRVRAQAASDRLEVRAAREDVQAAALSLAGEVAEAWIDLLALREEMQVLEEQIQTNRELLRLQILRFEKGTATALEVTQQRELLASSRSDLPPLQAAERLALNRLALLLGRADPQGIAVTRESLPDPIPRPENGVPVGLLASRPDVRAAFLRLRASDWSVSAARADRLPGLSISGRTALNSDRFRLVWGNWLTRLGGELAGPLLDAGLRRAEVERQRGAAAERLAAYAATVLEAVKEVQDALANEDGQRRRISRLREELRAAAQAREQARLRYLKGQGGFLDFLTQQRSVQSLERRLVTARADLLVFRVALFRALGRGWTSQELRPLADCGLKTRAETQPAAPPKAGSAPPPVPETM